MKISVSAQRFSMDPGLQDHVRSKLSEIISKYFESAVSTDVHFNKENGDYSCHIIVNEGSGRHLIIKSEYRAEDQYISFDVALTKLEKQLRKYKSRFKDRHNVVKVSEINEKAVKYVIEPLTDEEEEEFEDKCEPKIIAEKPVEIRILSLKEAVTIMDLENLPALMFKNDVTGKINVVYYKRDGNIAWIDSK